MAVSGFAAVMAEGIPADDARREDVAGILATCDGGAHLTRKLLAYIRKESSHPMLVDTAAELQRLSPLLSTLLGSTGTLDVNGEAPSDECPGAHLVRIDSKELERVLGNLATNARDAMPHGGTLSITSGVVELASERGADAKAPPVAFVPPSRFVRLRVRDTGIGMTADVKARVFGSTRCSGSSAASRTQPSAPDALRYESARHLTKALARERLFESRVADIGKKRSHRLVDRPAGDEHEPRRERGVAVRDSMVEIHPAHVRHHEVAEDHVERGLSRGLHVGQEDAERLTWVVQRRHVVLAP